MKYENESPYTTTVIWNLLLVRTHATKVIFISCSHVNSLKLHDVILTDQWGVVLKITTQYDTERKIDFKKFSSEEAHVWGIRSLPSSSLTWT